MKKEKIQQLAVRSIPYIIVFFAAFAVGLICYAIKDVSPFGEQTMVCMDFWAQYLPMYAEKVHTDSLNDFFYSWNGSFGYNAWAQSAYYGNSIFTLPLFLMPLKMLTTYFDWVMIIKMGLCAVTCLGLLQFKTKSRSPFLMGGAVAYAVSAYMLAFMPQIMWTDCVIYMPLLLIGLDKLIHEKKPLLYTCMLAWIIITNFYIGFAICIFCCLYFAASYVPMIQLTKNSENLIVFKNGRELGHTLARFSVFSLLGGAAAGAVIVPIGLAISQAISSELAAPSELKWYANISSILQYMLPNAPITTGFTGYNLWCGIAVFILVPLYFFNKNFSVKERISNAVLVVFMGISLVCNYLDYLWHGLHFPNQLPARWSFLFILLFILLSCRAFMQLKGVKLPYVLASIGIGATAIIVGVKGFGKTEPTELGVIHWIVFALVAALLIASAILANPRQPKPAEVSEEDAEETPQMPVQDDPKKVRARRIGAGVCAVSMAVLMMGESGYSFIMSYKDTESYVRPLNGAFYKNRSMQHYNAAKDLKSGEDGFWRMEANAGFTYDAPMIGDYKGMSYYSSTMRGDSYRLLEYLGNRVYAKNVSSVYNLASPVQNALFSVRYNIDFAKNSHLVMPDCSVVLEQDDACIVTENEKILSLGYAVSDDILNFTLSDEVRAIVNQSKFVNALCGEDMKIFQQMRTTAFSYENLKLDESSNWNTNYYIKNDNADEVFFHYTYTCKEDGYVFMENNFRAGSLVFTWGENQTKKYDPGKVKFDALGYFKAGDVINIVASAKNIRIGCCGLNLYRFDEEAWQKAYDRLADEQLQIDEFDNTYIKGTVNLKEDQLFMTSIAQDGGWDVYCDGEKMDTEIIAGQLLGVQLPAGTHVLEFRYKVPGLAVGMVISILGVLCIIFLSRDKVREKIAERFSAHMTAQPEETSEDDASAEEETAAEEASEESASAEKTEAEKSEMKSENKE